MKVFEISILVFLMQDIQSHDTFSKIGGFIDSGMAKEPELLKLHQKNTYKNYCFCSFYPIAGDKMYRKGNTFTIRMRTVDPKLAKFFNDQLVNHYNISMKGLTSNIRALPRRHIEKIYSITPSIMKTDNGYWRNNLSISDFERRLKDNLIKKYNRLMNTAIDENFQLYTLIEFKNKKPVTIGYKGRKLLGDKLDLHISDNKMAQELAYLSLGTGLMEINARGAGYVNAKFL